MQKNKPNSQSVDVGENGSQPSQELIDQQAKLEVLSAEGEHSVGESNESRTFESTLTEEHPEIGHVERSHAQEWKAVEIAPDDVGAMLDNVRDRSEKAEFSVDASNAWECLQVSAAVVGCGPLSDSLLQSLVPRVIDHCNNDCNASNVSQEFPESRGSVADDILAAYRFGDGVTVVEQDNWSTEDPDDYTKIVYIEYDDDAPDADSHKVSFHVRFNSDGSVDDAYGLEMDGGNDIGERGDLSSTQGKALDFLVEHLLPIREAIRRYGLESLRGRPVQNGSITVYISDDSLDDAIDLWEDEPKNAYRTSRFYGAETPNANLVKWIYATSPVCVAVSYEKWLAALQAGDIVEVPFSSMPEDIKVMTVQRIECGFLWLLPEECPQDTAENRVVVDAVSGMTRHGGTRIAPPGHTKVKPFAAPSVQRT